MSGRLRIVLASSRAHYPEGGGHLSHFLRALFPVRMPWATTYLSWIHSRPVKRTSIPKPRSF